MGNKQANFSSNLSTRSAINSGQLLAPQNRISRRGSELRARQPADSVPNEKSQTNGSAFDSARQSSTIFTEAEELKQIFDIPMDLRGKKLRSDPKFIAHTTLFTDTFDFVIRNLDDIGMVTENAEQLGRRHATLLPADSFRPEYWSIFTECIVEGACPSSEDKETQIAWRQLVMTIIYYMKLGYERESLRITRHASMKRSTAPMAKILIPNGE